MTQWIHRILAVAAILSTAFLLTTAAQSPTSQQIEPQAPVDSGEAISPPAIEDIPELWFVELNSPPSIEGTNPAVLKKEKDDFRTAATRAGLAFKERYAFDVLWNGLSVQIPKSSVSALARVAGVTGVYPVVPFYYSQDQITEDPNLFTAVTMTGANIAQNTLGYTGAGVKVAVMDTGIDYTHPDLGGCFGPGCRVAKGYDFVGDAFDNSAVTTPTPDPDPMDCEGHGTHVSGIIGAKAASAGGVTGVAPGVTFHAYRVFGCNGSTTGDIMIAAMERALADGSDVLNMSIGSTAQWPQYPTAAAATRLVNNGVVVVASAGNDGALGLYGSSAPAVGTKVISVASVDNIATRMPFLTVSPGGNHIDFIAALGAPSPPKTGTYQLARTGTPASTTDGCSPISGVSGRVVLIRRGTCSFYAKAFNAQSAGALGVVLYNNTTGIVSPTVEGTPPITIPVVSISSADGVTINNLIAAGTTTMTWTNQFDSIANPTGNLISSFSSYGLSPNLDVKPDISAPGGLIFSTYPVAKGSYATISGTSMSSPHVAGAAALLLQAHPHTPSNALRSILQNSALPRLWAGNPGLGFLDTVQHQGAGILRIDRAIQATTSIEPGKLSLGESEFGPAVRTLNIENNGATDVTYNLSHTPALATGPNTFTVSFFNTPASVAFSAPTVFVPAGGSNSVDVTITAPSGLADRSLYGGYIVLTPQGGGQDYRVPYSGFKGDYQSITVLTPTSSNFPWLAKLVTNGITNQPTGASYTMQGPDVPYFVFHLDHESNRLQLDVVDTNGKSWHRAFRENYIIRNSGPSTAFIFSWDGFTTAGNKTYTVPNGTYRVVMTVIKALGDETNPAHVETWTSPIITIARP